MPILGGPTGGGGLLEQNLDREALGVLGLLQRAAQQQRGGPNGPVFDTKPIRAAELPGVQGYAPQGTVFLGGSPFKVDERSAMLQNAFALVQNIAQTVQAYKRKKAEAAAAAKAQQSGARTIPGVSAADIPTLPSVGDLGSILGF